MLTTLGNKRTGKMQKFYVTFGQKYKREPHPKASWISPDGVLLVEAQSYRDARELTFKALGDRFCGMHMYDEKADISFHYPLGIIGYIKKDGLQKEDEQ